MADTGTNITISGINSGYIQIIENFLGWSGNSYIGPTGPTGDSGYWWTDASGGASGDILVGNSTGTYWLFPNANAFDACSLISTSNFITFETQINQAATASQVSGINYYQYCLHKIDSTGYIAGISAGIMSGSGITLTQAIPGYKWIGFAVGLS